MPNPIDIQVHSKADTSGLQQADKSIKDVAQSANTAENSVRRVNESVEKSHPALVGMTGQLNRASAAYGRVMSIAGRVTGAIGAISTALAVGTEAWALYSAKVQEAALAADFASSASRLAGSLDREIAKRKELGIITQDQAVRQQGAIKHAGDLHRQRLITDIEYKQILAEISKELIAQTTIPKKSTDAFEAERQAQLAVLRARFQFEEHQLKDSLERREITIEEYRTRLEQMANEIAAKESSILVPGLSSPNEVERIKAAAEIAKTQIELKSKLFDIQRLKDKEEPEETLSKKDTKIHASPKTPVEDISFNKGVVDFMNQGLIDLNNHALIAAQTFQGTLGSAVQGLSDGLTGIIFKTGNWGQVWALATQRIIGSLIQLGVQMVAQFVLAKIWAAIAGKSIQASMTPAAVTTGAATFGSNAAGVGVVVASILSGIANLAFAEGGMVPGSPSHRDNRMAHVASGEYIHRTAAVQYYGPAIMESINRKLIPRDLLESLTMPAPRVGMRSFAVGGLVADMTQPTASPINVSPPRVNVAVLNSRAELRDYLESAEGQTIIYDAARRRTMDLGIRS